jgi:Prokaryotic Cytochrome C oxidase subunit IV
MSERSTRRDSRLIVWMVLLAATLLSGVLGIERSQPSTVVGVLVISIGCVKLRLVTIHFMELGGAPLWLRLAAEAYSVILIVTLLVLYLAA